MTRYAPPPWAADIVRDVCAKAGIPEPRVNWRKASQQGQREWSHGTAYAHQGRIDIGYGGDRLDQKLVLLHELAHLIAPKDDSHTKLFWNIAYDLYERYGLADYASVEREVGYMATGVRVAYERGHLTAEQRDDLLLCHRLADSKRPKNSPRWLIHAMNAAKRDGMWPTMRLKWEQALDSNKAYLKATAESRRRWL